MYTVHFAAMFATVEAHRSPLTPQFGQMEETHWVSVELVLSRPWFLVSFTETSADSYSEIDDDLPHSRTILTYGIGSVENLVQSNANGARSFESVQMCTPDHMNGTGGWLLETLDAVYTAHHPDYPAHTIDVFVTTEGKRYPSCSLGIGADNLTLRELWFKAPART